jgi:hypothetical protein
MVTGCLCGLKTLAGTQELLVVLAHLVGVPPTIGRPQIAAGTDFAAEACTNQSFRSLQQVQPFGATSGLRSAAGLRTCAGDHRNHSSI